MKRVLIRTESCDWYSVTLAGKAEWDEKNGMYEDDLPDCAKYVESPSHFVADDGEPEEYPIHPDAYDLVKVLGAVAIDGLAYTFTSGMSAEKMPAELKSEAMAFKKAYDALAMQVETWAEELGVNLEA